jgi:Uma2 family endonuclease
MSTTTPQAPASPVIRFQTAADWLHALGDVPLERIVFDPLPGTATIEDMIRRVDSEGGRGAEWVYGTLVEKPVGFEESIIAGILLTALNNVVRPQRLGVVTGEQGMIRMLMGNVRMPDVAFFRREDLPGGRVPAEPAPRIAPALAVEVLSPSNTDAEMRIKRQEYFDSGTYQVWLLDPTTQTLHVYDAPERFRQLTRDDVLEDETLLPGFTVRVGELFAT